MPNVIHTSATQKALLLDGGGLGGGVAAEMKPLGPEASAPNGALRLVSSGAPPSRPSSIEEEGEDDMWRTHP
jgi:hypothetical protein